MKRDNYLKNEEQERDMRNKSDNNGNDFKNFWNFFSAIEKQIIVNPTDDLIIKELDKEVYKLGEVDWEYGPNVKNSGFYFCLSPNFKFDLIDYCSKIISYAPKLENWIFTVGKPQKPNEIDEFYITYQDKEILISTREWRFIIYKFKDGTYDLDILLSPKVKNLDENLLVDIAITNSLGEIHYMKKIGNVSIVDNFDNDHNQSKGIEFKYLDELIK